MNNQQETHQLNDFTFGKDRVRTSQPVSRFQIDPLTSSNFFNPAERLQSFLTETFANQQQFFSLPQKFQVPSPNQQLIKHKEKLRAQSAEYQHLHQKIQSIEVRVSEMKIALQKKKQNKNRRIQSLGKQDSFLPSGSKEAFSKRMSKPDIPERKKSTEKFNLKKRESSPVRRKVGVMNNEEEIQIPPRTNRLKDLVTQLPRSHGHYLPYNPYSPRNNIYYVSEVIKAYQDEKSLVREHINDSIQILRKLNGVKMPGRELISKKAVNLKKRKGYEDKKTIIFDMDETLIHCVESPNMESDAKLSIKLTVGGENLEAGINIRPFVNSTLKELNKYFEVMVFTASHSSYANVVLDHLDPTGELIHHRLYREHCILATNQGPYVKDLRILNRDLSQVVLVDNAAYSYSFQLDNGIPIIPYYSGKQDYELPALQTYLQKLLLAKDVREVNRKTFKLHEYTSFENCEELVQKLYLH